MNYRVAMWGCLGLAAASWAVVTGLSIEKMLADGVQSWTLFLAMPVFVAAVALMIHQAVEDFREWRIVRPLVGLALAGLTLSVTLPNSIGTSGAAKDTAVAQAQASNRNLAFSETMLKAAKTDLDLAKAGVAKECVGVPEVIKSKEWPNCRWWRRQVDAHTLAVEKYGQRFIEAPAEVKALSGDTRIAWALSSVGSKLPEKFAFSVSEADVAMAQPMLPPIAGELLCAFFGFMGLEFRKRALADEAAARKLQHAEAALAVSQQGDEARLAIQRAVDEALHAKASVQADYHVQGELPAPEMLAGRQPDPKPRKKASKRQRRTETGLMKLRARTLAGERPTLRVIMGRHKVSKATASRWRAAVAA